MSGYEAVPPSGLGGGGMIDPGSNYSSLEVSNEAISRCLGKEIRCVDLDERTNEIRIWFYDGPVLVIRDAGQSCCEHRYISTDDCVDEIYGDLISIDTVPVETVERGSFDVQECVFLKLVTNNGTSTFKCYNLHNGYYGGFDIEAIVYERVYHD